VTVSPDAATVREILETSLGTSLVGIENPGRNDVEVWDSLAHLSVVFMLEEEYDTRFTAEEIAALNSVSEIVAIVQAKHAT
jgi:acyl carrier protein